MIQKYDLLMSFIWMFSEWDYNCLCYHPLIA